MLPMGQHDEECDMLIAGDSSSTVAAKNKLAAQNQLTSGGAKGLAGWLTHLGQLSQFKSSHLREARASAGSQHLAAMSSWLHVSSHHKPTRGQQQQQQQQQQQRQQHRIHLAASETQTDTRQDHNCGLSKLTYGVLDDQLSVGSAKEIEYSQDDGFELGAPDTSCAGRKSPNYPFYTFYHHHRRRNCCRLLPSIACILLLLLLFVILLCRLIVLIRHQQQQLNQQHQLVHPGSSSGGHAWIESAGSSRDLDRQQLEAGRANRWLVSSPKCHIPVLDPWDESIQDYVERKPVLECDKVYRKHGNKAEPRLMGLEPLTFTRNNRLYFTGQALELGFLSEQRCCYININRSHENDDDLVRDDKLCHIISTDGLIMAHNLIEVMCQDRALSQLGRSQVHTGAQVLPQTVPVKESGVKPPDSFIYRNVHSFIVRNMDEEAALDRVAGRRLNQDEYYNVVMIGVDTISRLNGYRQLSRTLSRLRRDYNTLEFVGYNKVGENTFPNVVPLLTGLRPEQLTEIQCWQASNYSQETETGDDFMDNCKYLWNFYQELGYITYYSEDWPKASTFNYLKQGFRQEPTTFYGRPFTLARDKLLLPPVNMGCSSCLLDRPLVQVDLENLQNFIAINKDRPHFAFHWINCPQHDDLNGASMVDTIFDDFFRQLKSLTYDNRTFVIFFSDHGYRWNDFVSTRIGHYETSLPLLTLAPPRRFIERHPDLYDNLKRHQSALLTPFDLFKTLVDIRDLARQKDATTQAAPRPQPTWKNLKSGAGAGAGAAIKPLAFEDPQYSSAPTAATTIKQLEQLDGLSYRQTFETLSLLARHNSTQLDRSCIEAGIPDNYCVCHQFEETPINTNDVLGAAYYFVYVHLYTRIKDHKLQCHLLDLEQIHKAEHFEFKQAGSESPGKRRRRRDIATSYGPTTTTTPGPQGGNSSSAEKEVSDSWPNREYNIRLSTKPGGGLFQEVIRYYGPKSREACDKAVDVAKSTIDRLGDGKEFELKHRSVVKMNEVCKFSVHSDSISRLNLYKDQSKCVKNNIEVKKVCYCLDLDTKSPDAK